MTDYDYSRCNDCGIELHTSEMTQIGGRLVCRRCLPAALERTPLQPAGPRLPRFCRVIFMIDSAFAMFRAFVVVLGILALTGAVESGETDRPMMIQGILEVATGLGIAVFGIMGNRMMLRGDRHGFYMGWANIIACLAASGVGLLGIATTSNKIAEQGIPLVVVLILALIIGFGRLGLSAIYAIALMQFKGWSDEELRR